MTFKSIISRWGFGILLALAGWLVAWLLTAPLAQAKVAMDPPLPNSTMRQCMDCHRLPNLNSTEGVLANRALCQECHAKKEVVREVDGKAVSLRVDEKAFATSRHQMTACSQCHVDVARSPHRAKGPAQCLKCHAPHGEALVHDPHLRVACGACHHKSKFVTFDASHGQVVLARVNDKKQPIGLADHTPPDLSQDALCARCHHQGNQVGAAASVLPAKGMICFMCHTASFSIGSAWFGVALLVFVLGLLAMVSFWLKGSVAGETNSLHRKLAEGSETLWRTVFSKKIFAVLGVLFYDVLLGRRLLKESLRRWFFHSLIFLPLVLRMGLGLFSWLVYQVWPQSSLAMALIDKNHPFTAMFSDLMGLLMLLGILLSTAQRLAKPKNVNTEGQDAIALLLIGLMVLAGFVVEGVRILMTQVDPTIAVYAFVGYPLSRLFAALALDWACVYTWLWYIHAMLAAGFVAYLPFGKMRHMFTAPLSLILNRDLQ